MGKKTKTKAKKSASSNAAPAVPDHTSVQVPTVQQTSAKRQRHGQGIPEAGDEDGEGRKRDEGAENLQFEDPFGDEFEPEDVKCLEEAVEDDDREMGEERSKAGIAAVAKGNSRGTVEGKGIASMEVEEEDEEEELRQSTETKVWRAGIDELAEGEELEYDTTAYHMYHSLRPEWPCLSFDIIRDSLGTNRSRFPHTIFAVAGTQADRAESNRLQVMKLSDLHRTRKTADSDDEDVEEDNFDETDDDPILDHLNIPHRGGINRVRSMPQQSHIISTWSETSEVHVWDLERQISALAKRTPRISKVDPVFTFGGHKEEGFALDWSPSEEGHLLTGDCGSSIYLTQPTDGCWSTDPVPFVGHVGSVEDLQWSPTESTVFVSASADKTVAVWDVRRKNGSMLSLKAHEEDVNVISWNRNVTYLLASGSDDGSFKIWDLRAFGSGEPVAQFRWHKGPITSIEWHPTDESMLAASGADNQLSVWDLSVEADEERGAGTGTGTGVPDLPPQLLFIHQGQTDIKELHFHPQIPGVIMSTAADGFNIFKPATTV